MYKEFIIKFFDLEIFVDQVSFWEMSIVLVEIFLVVELFQQYSKVVQEKIDIDEMFVDLFKDDELYEIVVEECLIFVVKVEEFEVQFKQELILKDFNDKCNVVFEI